jgi:hypothetical protein
MRITLHSPLDCPGCGSRFEGAWVPGKETSGQACLSCGEVFTATWKGWTFLPEQATVTRDEPPEILRPRFAPGKVGNSPPAAVSQGRSPARKQGEGFTAYPR